MTMLVVISFVIILVISCVLRYLWLRTFSSPRPRQAEHELDVLESQFNSEEIDETVGDNPTHSCEVLKSSIIISRFYLIIYIIIPFINIVIPYKQKKCTDINNKILRIKLITIKFM